MSFFTERRVLIGVSWTMTWTWSRHKSVASPVCLYAHFSNTSSAADVILLGGGDLSWQRPQHRLILEISYFMHLLLASCFYINSALQSPLLFYPVSREIACWMVTLRKMSSLDSVPRLFSILTVCLQVQ